MLKILRHQGLTLLVRGVDFSRRHHWLVFGVAILLAVASVIYIARNIAINTDTSDMLSPDLPFRKYSQELSQAFPQFSDNILVVIDGEYPDLADEAALELAARLRANPSLFGDVYDLAGDAYFRKNGLLYKDLNELEALSDRLARMQPFLATLYQNPSLEGLFGLLELAMKESKPEELKELGPVLQEITKVAKAMQEGRFGLLSWQNLMQGEAEKGRRMFLIRPALNFGSLQPASDAIDEIRRLGAELGISPDKGLRLRLTGSAALSQEELKSVEEGMGWANLVALGLVVVLLFIGLKSKRLVAKVFITLIFGLIYSTALAIIAVGKLNLISVAFAVLFVGIGVDFGIHFALRYREGLDRHKTHHQAISWAGASVGGPLSMCATAAAIGFFSFLPTAYLGLAELGLIAGISMFVALVANITILPALLTHKPLKPGDYLPEEEVFYTNPLLFRLVNGREKKIALGALVMALAGAAFLPMVRFDFDPLNLKDPKAESVATLFDLMENKRTSPYSITILANSFTEAGELAAKLKEIPEVDGTATILDYIPKDQDAKLEVIYNLALILGPVFGSKESARPDNLKAFNSFKAFISAWDKELSEVMNKISPDKLDEFEYRLLRLLPGRLLALKTTLQAGPVELKDLPRSLYEREVTADGRLKLGVYPRDDLRNPKALQRFTELVSAVAPNATGSPVVINEAGKAVVKAFLDATIITISALFLVMILLLRNIRDTLLVFAPLLLAALLLIPISVMGGLPFNFANVIVLPLLFGLGIANGIQFVGRERMEHNPVKVLRTSTPRAIIFSALTTLVSFGALATSTHPGTASMGVLLAIAIVLTLLCTLMVLPALMVIFPGHRKTIS